MTKPTDAVPSRAASRVPDGSEPSENGPLDAAAPVEGDTPNLTVALRRKSLAGAVHDAWAERRLFWGLAAQGVALREPRWVLGSWWFPIIILFNLVGLAFIFGSVLNVSSNAGVPYFLFVAAGMTVWWFFYRGTIFSMRSFYFVRRLVTGFSLPLLHVPLAGVVMGSLFGLFSLAIFLLAFPVFWALDGELYLDIGPGLLLAPFALLWACLLAALIGLWTGPIYWRARDVRQIFRIILPFILYVTPILYPLSTLEAAVGPVANLNPLVPPVEIFRMAVFGTEGPPAYAIGVALGLTAVLLVGGCWFTNRFGYTFLSWEPTDLEDEEV